MSARLSMLDYESADISGAARVLSAIQMIGAVVGVGVGMFWDP